jgi:SAM-dependent methyltransferase
VNRINLWLPVAGMDLTISPNDGMMTRDEPPDHALSHYLESGRSALRCVRAALTAAGKTDVRRILDLPCGHGRVLRVLKAAFPRAALTACDIDRDGVDFCAAQFGAEPVYSVEDPALIPVRGPFDLIWVGSLLTHLDAPAWPAFLSRFRSLLGPDGVCVFTAHGVGAGEYIRAGRSKYGLPDPGKLLALYERHGFGFVPYQPGGRYGVSMSSAAWVIGQIHRLPDTRVVMYTEKGWHNHQDAVAFGPFPPPEWVRLAVRLGVRTSD